jgi:DNA-binding beta-propeller fold protein YncE
MFTRRAFVAGSVAFAAACGSKKGTGFPGYAFVANQEGGTVSAVDLTNFSVARQIRLDGYPSELIAHPANPTLYGLTPENGTIHEIDARELAVVRKRQVAPSVSGMRLTPDARALWVLSPESKRLIRLPLAEFGIDAYISLKLEPTDFDLSRYFNRAAVSHGPEGALTLIDLETRSAGAPLRIGKQAGVIRFRYDGRQVLAACPSERLLSVVDAAARRLVVQLPLAVEPRHFCFKRDGGQLFVSGPGMDAVVVVYPYDTQVAETVLAGHAPGFMASSSQPEYLFVTNPQSGEVTILDIDAGKTIAVARVGSEPSFVEITPDNQYALVLNRSSGDMAVIRLAAITAKRTRTAPLFTMIPVGSRPVSAAVRGV